MEQKSLGESNYFGNDLKELEASLDASNKDDITFNLLNDTNYFPPVSRRKCLQF